MMKRSIDPCIFRWAAPWLLAFAALPVASPLIAGGTPASSTVADELITVTGSQSDTADGDWISAFTDPMGDGLDTHHSFFIEVPTGASRLVVDLFDMDILFEIDDTYMTGVTPAEQLAERDRIRAYSVYLDDTVGNFSNRISYTFATYSLFDPSGTQVVTRRIHGSHFAPSDGDDAWVTFYDSSTTFDSGTFDTWADDFSGGTYAENDGTQLFTTDWIESQETGVNSVAGPGGGLLRITGGQLQIRDLGDFSPDTGREPGIERELDLTGYVAARLEFDFTASNDIEDDDCIVLEMSDDGGATWTAIDDFSGEELTYSGTLQYDISEFISAETRVRFRVENLYAGSAEHLFIDNFEIRAQTASPAAPEDGHWELRVDVSTGALRAATVAASRNGDETNAFGFRAHDGDETAGGAEYNAYTYTYTAGINPNDSGRDYNLYPYITRDCEFDVNDFDWDSDLPNNPGGPNAPFGTLVVESPDTSFTSSSTGNLSPNNMWATTTATTFTDNDTASQYGLWTMPFRVEDPNDGNYAPIYLADGDDAGTPLLSPLPDPDTYRIYLPSDGDGLPAKPYLQQFLTKAIVADPNPPGPGQTARYAVTVRLVNPSGSIGDIQFDGVTRTVTTRFPGGMAAYEGIAILDQGTIVSQPTVGSTTPGDIVWNPGTLAAGSGGNDTVARLVYFFELSGAAAPYSLNAAEVPGSGNGTRATWIDETGEDFTFGELCQMTISSPAPPTPVVVSEVRGTIDGGVPTVHFETASEAEALSFLVERRHEGEKGQQWRPIHSGRLPALLDQPQGGVYRVADAASTGERALYRLRESNSSGAERVYGPFEVEFDATRDAAPSAMSSTSSTSSPDFTASPHPPSREHAERRRAARLEDESGSRAEKLGGPALWVKVGVDETGIQRLEVADLVASFFVPASEIEDALASGGFNLLLGSDDDPFPANAERIAWSVSPDGDALEFYGQAADTPYTGTNIYWLERAPGLVMRRTPGRAVPPDWSGETFMEQLRVEENNRPVVILELDPESDNWFWELVRAGDPAEAFSFEVPDPTGLGKAELTLHLQGASDGEHRLDVRLGGVLVGEAQVSGREAADVLLSIDPALLVDGANTVELTGTAGDLVAVDAFTVTYERLSRAVDDRLEMPATSGRIATASGFRRDDLRILDLADPLKPRHVAARVLDDGESYRALWRQTAGAGPFHLATSAGVRTPQLVSDVPSDLRASTNEADYLLIAPTTLVSTAEGLAAWRQSQGLTSQVVDLEDVYDEFSAGLSDPRAIRDFLEHAVSSWQLPPRYAVLVGHGTYDYRDWYGLGGNLLPPLLWSRGGTSLFPTDAHFADADADGSPSLAVGRLPVMNTVELQEQIDKIIAYESLDDPSWQSEVALVADGLDDAGDFIGDADHLSRLVPSDFQLTEIFLDEQPDLETARQLLLDGLDLGLAHLHYVGHGGFDRLSQSGLLTSTDIPALANEDRPGFLTAASCTLGLHALPGLDSLAELMVLQAEGGSIAAFAPAWLSENEPAGLLHDRLFRELYNDTENEETRLGDAVWRALSSAAVIGTPVDLLYTYQLIGDPALVLQLQPEPGPPGCSEDCGSG